MTIPRNLAVELVEALEHAERTSRDFRVTRLLSKARELLSAIETYQASDK